MTRREKILEMEPETTGFLDDRFDELLIGSASRGPAPAGWVACYDYAAALRRVVTEASSPEVVFRRLEGVLPFRESGPLILLPCRRRYLWDQVKDSNLVLWDHLGDAVIGTGTFGFSPEAVVYNYERVLDCLDLNQSDSEEAVTASETFDNLLRDAWVGPHTPWFCRVLQ